MWHEGDSTPAKYLTGVVSARGLFVTSNGDVYVANSSSTSEVDKWASNATSTVVVIYTTSNCFSLFIDINNTLYCSLSSENKVVKTSLNGNSTTTLTVAGNGSAGSLPNMLNGPNGIFVDQNFNLYIADTSNNRIQLFNPGQLNGTTVVTNGPTGTITLSSPSRITLDGDGYLFIVDGSNNRIIGSGPTGFRCIVGCSGVGGSQSDQLSNPRTVAFDSYGNMLVVDRDNSRVQKFFLASNSCGKFNHI
jgi:hypothetical protein